MGEEATVSHLPLPSPPPMSFLDHWHDFEARRPECPCRQEEAVFSVLAE